MTKKDYELIARSVVGWYKVYNVTYLHFDGLVNHLADRLEINDKLFNRSKFLQACGLEV